MAPQKAVVFVTRTGAPVVVEFMTSDGVNVTTPVASSSTKDRFLKKLIFFTQETEKD